MLKKYFKVIFTTLILWCGALELRLQAIPDTQSVKSFSSDEIDTIIQNADTLSQQYTDEFVNEILFDVEDSLLEQETNEKKQQNTSIFPPIQFDNYYISIYNKDINTLTPIITSYFIDFMIYKNWYIQLSKEMIRGLICNQDILLNLAQELLEVENSEASEQKKEITRKKVHKKISDNLHTHFSSKKTKFIASFSCASFFAKSIVSLTSSSDRSHLINYIFDYINQAISIDQYQKKNCDFSPPEIHVSLVSIFSLASLIISFPTPLSLNDIGESFLPDIISMPSWATDWKALFAKEIISQVKIYNDNINEYIENITYEISSKYYSELEQLLNAEKNCALIDKKIIIQQEIKDFYIHITSRSFIHWLTTRKSKQTTINTFFYLAALSPKIIDFAQWILSP